ncbi:MAG: hypothetical protein ACODAD_06115 [Planctomycetota bacterium]
MQTDPFSGLALTYLATDDLQDGSQFNASPVVVDNRILLRSDKFLYCLQP